MLENLNSTTFFENQPVITPLTLRVLRKPTSPPLPLREGPPRFFESLRLPFQRELHLFPQAPSSSEGGGCNRSSSELKPLRYKDGGPSEVCASFLCGMGPHGQGAADGLLEAA